MFNLSHKQTYISMLYEIEHGTNIKGYLDKERTLFFLCPNNL